MKQTNGTINGIKVTLAVVEPGEKVRAVRQALGVEIDADYSVSYRGEDFDDATDFAHGQPKTAQVLHDAGINFDNAIAIIEVRL